jgi:hypothetical protein
VSKTVETRSLRIFKANYARYAKAYNVDLAFTKALTDVDAEMGVNLSFTSDGAASVVHAKYPGGSFVESVDEPLSLAAKLKLAEMAFARSGVRAMKDRKLL